MGYGREEFSELMTEFVLAIVFTLGVSAFCSLLEALILSTTSAEIEGLKQSHPWRGALLERYKFQIEETTSAILTLNTIANTAGAAWIGSLAEGLAMQVALVSGFLVFSILIFSEVLPKNIGVAYRRKIQPLSVYALGFVRISMLPASFFLKYLVATLVKLEAPTEEEQEEEIKLLAEKSAASGALSSNESELIKNVLSLDDSRIEEIMTPRTVTMFLSADSTVDEVCSKSKNIPFARIPVFEEGVDDIIGLVRRRDILQAYSEDRESLAMRELMNEILYLPETASVHDGLQQFLKKHQQFAVIVDEYGSTVGVLTMEDIVEHLLGDEIYEASDVAVDMRELAKKRGERSHAHVPGNSDLKKS